MIKIINTPLLKLHIPETKRVRIQEKPVSVQHGRYTWLFLWGGAVVQVNTFGIVRNIERFIAWVRQPRIDRPARAVRLYRRWHNDYTGEWWSLTGRVLVLGDRLHTEALEWHLYDLVGCVPARYSGPGRYYSSPPGYRERQLIPGVRLFTITQRGGLDI